MTIEELTELRAQLGAEGRYDPLLFAEKAWSWGEGDLEGQDIRAWQSEVLDDIAQHLLDKRTRYQPLFISVASGHGIGKSALSGILTTWGLSCYRDPRIVLTAGTEGQLRTKTSPEVGQWVRTSAFGNLYECDTLSIRRREAPDQHRADFTPWSETRPESFAGLHARGRLVLVIMDEASQIPDVIWETILGALTDEETVLIFVALGNPTRNRGYFRETHRRYRKTWKRWQIDSRTVEGTNKAALQAIVDQFGEHSDQAKVRVKGQFPAASAMQFIPTPYVDAAFGRHLRKEAYSFAPVILSCDPAWEGDDLTIIMKRQGLYSEILLVLEKNTNDIAVASKLAALEDLHKADGVIIDGGYGTGIYSAGKTWGRDWQIVWFGGEASDAGYLNKRAQMWGEMRAWLHAGGAIPKEQRLYDDLVQVETKAHVEGKIQLQPKKEMKKEGLPSPDYGDALAITFAYPVSKKEAHREPGQRDYTVTSGPRKSVVFDPYGDA